MESGTPTAWVPQSKPVWFTELGCPAIDRGTNQPNVFFDPKSSESFTPYFSRGWRDDAIQRAYLEASYLWWGLGANNPTSSIYGGRMVHVPECAAWTWDARPYPFFPELTGVWTDGRNWRLGHWLTGRLGAVSLAALVRHLCLRAGLNEALIDVSGIHDSILHYSATHASGNLVIRRSTGGDGLGVWSATARLASRDPVCATVGNCEYQHLSGFVVHHERDDSFPPGRDGPKSGGDLIADASLVRSVP